MELSFGEKIRSLREDMELNQTQLGQALNMTQRKISYIECGKYEPVSYTHLTLPTKA